MTQAEQEIADLDYVLSLDCEIVTLIKNVDGGEGASVDCPAKVTGLQSDHLVDTVKQQEFKVIISPTPIDDASWPAAPVSPAPAIDPRVPVKKDWCVVAGRRRSIEAALPIKVGNVLVRIEMRVKG